MKLINFHTHKPQFNSNSICIVPFNVDNFKVGDSFQYGTIGIHPWKTDNSEVDLWLEELKNLLKQKTFIGIGEIGLDRLKGAPLDAQISIFEKEFDIATEVDKPIIIHCVRCWSEVMAILSIPKYRNLTKAIHGFRAKPEIVKSLIEKGFYISFGTSIIHSTPELAEAVTIVPKSRLFLETDDTETHIFDVYDAAADILDTTIEELVNITSQNFSTFFGSNLP